MGGDFQLFDIILFAMIAAFLVLRLRNVLGKRIGHDRDSESLTRPSRGNDTEDNVIDLSDRKDDRAPDNDSDFSLAEEERSVAADDSVGFGLTQVAEADPAFDPEEFLTGARGAFEMVISSFTAGDRDTLRELMNDEVYTNICAAIDQREKENQTQQTDIVGFKASKIIEARLEGRIAFVTVKFRSDQINATLDSEGRVRVGDPNQINTVEDIWTFARNTRSQDPNWKLVETRSPS